MAVRRHHRWEGCWIFGVVAGLFVVLVPLIGAWPQGKAMHTSHARQRGLEKRSHVVVQRGQLSVDLREADLGEVLAEIGRQAGIHMVFAPGTGQRISAQFAGVELEPGLRRLLRLASLSYMILYGKESAGGGAIQEVRVFGGKNEGASPQPTVAEREVEESVPNTGNPFHKLLEQAQGTGLLSPGSERREAIQWDENDAAHRLRAIFRPPKARDQGIAMPTNPADVPGRQSEGQRSAADSSR